MRILQIAFLLIVCGCLQAFALGEKTLWILEIEKLTNDVTLDLFERFALLDEDIRKSPNAPESVRQGLLFKEFKVLKHKVDMFNATMFGSQVLDALVNYTNIHHTVRKPKLEDLKRKIDFIYVKYEDMGTFIENHKPLRSATFKVDSLVDGTLDGIYEILAGSEVLRRESIFKFLIMTMKKERNETFCKRNSSEQQLILYLYNTLALAELKGFLMMELSYMLRKLDNQGDFAKEMRDAQHSLKRRSATYLSLTIEAVEQPRAASLELWKCDPKEHVKDETYIEITGLRQGYIVNRRNIGTQAKDRLCSTAIKFTDTYKHNECFNNNAYDFCGAGKMCTGTLTECRNISNLYQGYYFTMSVCLADGGTNRRYEYIIEEKMLGRRVDCPRYLSKEINHQYVESATYPPKTYGCDYFRCFCDEEGVSHSDRYFSLMKEESDVHHNMVVTGLRFVKKNRIIHLQIQQGKLLPMGKIDVTTVSWKPVINLNINHTFHYHTLTLEKRGVNLDNLRFGSGEVLTGVQFALIDSRLHLQIFGTPFNFATGTLEGYQILWNRIDSPLWKRRKINMDNKDIPIRSPFPSVELSEFAIDLVEFTPTDWDIDVAQTTVPFIDAQAVTSEVPVPLSGVGFMYKGSKQGNFGGFISPKIMTYDYLYILRNAYINNLKI